MMTDLDALRTKVRQLFVKREQGDLNEKAFQRLLTHHSIELYRALVLRRMAKDEEIQREHHTIRAHFKFTQSVLKEPEQEAISTFATDRRLYQVCSRVIPKQPPTADARDGTTVSELRYENMGSIQMHRQVRWGEVGVGAVISAVAILFAPWLEVTSHVMLGLGVLGVLHALLLPTRWIEIRAADPVSQREPIFIYNVRKKSARSVVEFVREKTSQRDGNQGSAR